MTREEAKEIISRHHWAFASMDDEVIEAIECLAEHCEDAISRRAVEDKLVKMCDGLEEIFANIRMQNVDESVCGLCEYDCPSPFECPGFETDECFRLADEIRHKWQSTKDLPSVTPKPKMGRWIMPVQDDGMSDPIYYQVRCSECGFDLDPQTWHMELHQYGADKYCPNCGANMEESEDKE